MNANAKIPNEEYITTAKNWIAWYIANTPSTGIIADYVGTAGNWTPSATNPPYDSVDAYIATFLSAAAAIAPSAVNDTAWTHALMDFLPTALSVISEITIKPSPSPAQSPKTANLTTQFTGSSSLPLFCYTEDNCEVYTGLAAATKLGALIGSLNPATQSAATRAAIDAALFSPDATPFARYALAAAPNGQLTPTTNVQTVFYPDQQVQLLALSHLPLDAQRQTLYANMKNVSYSQLPAVIANADPTVELNNLDQVVWWGLAALAIEGPGPNQTMTDIYNRLTAYDPGIGSWVHDIGHACTVLAAYVPLAIHPIPPPHRHGPEIRPPA
jgi:hypothetical protein